MNISPSNISSGEIVGSSSIVALSTRDQKHQRNKKLPLAEAVSTLALSLHLKHRELYQHSYHVSKFASYLTQALHLPENEQKIIELAGLFHDIGKLAIPDTILQKTSRLTAQEFEKIKEHPAHGACILQQIRGFEKIAPLVYYHHERWDGRGYPSGLSGEAIPLGSRIIAIADAFDVITSRRAYKAANTSDEALAELQRCAGTQFDPELVELFCQCWTTNTAITLK